MERYKLCKKIKCIKYTEIFLVAHIASHFESLLQISPFFSWKNKNCERKLVVIILIFFYIFKKYAKSRLHLCNTSFLPRITRVTLYTNNFYTQKFVYILLFTKSLKLLNWFKVIRFFKIFRNVFIKNCCVVQCSMHALS